MTQRARELLNLECFRYASMSPLIISTLMVKTPKESQYILRMMIKGPHTDLLLPTEVQWCSYLINRCISFQRRYFIEHPFIYLTIRHGIPLKGDDDVWHTDGFSTRIPHLPEQNYIWSNKYPTEFLPQNIHFPLGFDPNIHNIHKYIQEVAYEKPIKLRENQLVVVDPYSIHRRDPNATGERTFIRVSFVPIIIEDDSNAQNPLIPVKLFNKIGKTERDRLLSYHS